MTRNVIKFSRKCPGAHLRSNIGWAVTLLCSLLVACIHAENVGTKSALFYGDHGRLYCREPGQSIGTELAVLSRGDFILETTISAVDPARFLVGVDERPPTSIFLLTFDLGRVDRLVGGWRPTFLSQLGRFVFSAPSPTGRGMAVFSTALDSADGTGGQRQRLLDDGQYPSPRTMFPIDSHRVIYRGANRSAVILDVASGDRQSLVIPDCALLSARPRSPELVCKDLSGSSYSLRSLDGKVSAPISEDVGSPIFWSSDFDRLGFLRGRFQVGVGETYDVILYDFSTGRASVLFKDLPLQPGSAQMVEVSQGCSRLKSKAGLGF